MTTEVNPTGLNAAAPDPADTPSVPVFEGFFACACPCGCRLDSTVPASPAAALARHARCVKCGTPKHMNTYPIAKPDDGVRRKSITELYVPSEEEAEQSRSAAREVYGEIWRQQWDHWQASLPEKFRSAETEHAQVKERLRRLAVGERGVASLLVIGPPGSGKTFLSIGMANAAIKAGYFKPSEVLFGSEAELLASVANSGFGEVELGLRKVISPRVKLLVLDDVGRGTWLNEAMRPKVFGYVLDKFWSQNRVVVLTSNLEPAALGEYLGDGAMDRLKSMVGNAVLILDTESKRKKVTEEMLLRSKIKPTDPVPPGLNSI
jgi:DNA replication protein DnaC